MLKRNMNDKRRLVMDNIRIYQVVHKTYDNLPRKAGYVPYICWGI